MTGRATVAERQARREQRRAERAEIQDPDVVLAAAAAFLAVRPRSVEETRRRLRHLGYPEAPIEVVLDQLLAYGYLDDEAFARSWVESRDRARPRGSTALRRELSLRGVPRETIEALLAERAAGGTHGESGPMTVEATADSTGAGRKADADEQAARRLLARKTAALGRVTDPRRRRQRAYALLARNGFAPDVCARVSAEVADPAASDDAVMVDTDDV